MGARGRGLGGCREGDARRDTAVGERDTGGCRSGDARGDAGDDLERNPCSHERLDLLATTTEDERVAALEPDNAPAALRIPDE